MSNLIKTEVYLPKNFHLYQIPEIFKKPFEIKEDVFQVKNIDPFKLYVVIGDDREREKIPNAVFWNSLGGALLFESEYLEKYSSLELSMWEKVDDSLNVLEEKMRLFEKDVQYRDRENLSNLYHFYNNLLMYDGELEPFEYFLGNLSWGNGKKTSTDFLVLDNVSQNSLFKKVKIPEDKIMDFSLKYALYLKDFSSMKRKKTLRDSLRLVEEFFNNISVPIAVYDEFDDLAIHNKQFRDMGLLSDKVLNYNDNQTLDLNGELFTVSIKTIQVESKEYQIFTFLKGDKDTQYLIQIEEMGVITSSIAHELNNPIGGVLSGAEVLTSFDFGISQEGVEILHEIHKSSIRCSNLIKTFLGFARQEMSVDMKADPQEAIDQAMSFLRTRFMELGCKINIIYKKEENFPISNISLWTMIFYNFFTGILNFVIRQSLVKETKISEIPLLIEFKGHSLVINSQEYELDKVALELSQSSFFHHLLSFDGVELEYDSNSVIFKK